MKTCPNISLSFPITYKNNSYLEKEKNLSSEHTSYLFYENFTKKSLNIEITEYLNIIFLSALRLWYGCQLFGSGMDVNAHFEGN